MSTTFRLGGEVEVRRLGFGAMRIVHEPVEGVRVLRRAVELGVNLVDTADIYGAGASEELIAKALHPYPADLVIATKGGLGWGLQERIRDGRPEHLRRAVEDSLRRLRLERIDLYQLHRHDPEVPIEESVGALAELRTEGKIRLVGLSNVSVQQLRSAQAVTGIASVQNEFNRGLLTSEDVLEACEAQSVAFLPWAPLGQGLGSAVEELRWLLDRSDVILPIAGTANIAHLEENMRAGSLQFD
jgi:aryl-alcohol dehydrogenase-like predicted oxidoreductase